MNDPTIITDRLDELQQEWEEESGTIAAEDAGKSGRIHDRFSEADRAALHAARR